MVDFPPGFSNSTPPDATQWPADAGEDVTLKLDPTTGLPYAVTG